MAKKAQKDMIVLYPVPEIGHMVSMVEVAKLIHKHTPSLSITILITTSAFFHSPATDAYIRRVSAANPAISFLRLPFHQFHSAPAASNAAIAFHFIRLNAPHVSQALRDLSAAGGVRIRAFVIDLFCTSSLDAGRELAIPTYYFFTSGAAVLAAFLHFPTLHDQQASTASFKDMHGEVLQIPGMPPLSATQMPEPMLDRDDPAYWDMLYFCSSLSKSDGILTNTFAALEPIPISSVLSDAGVPPVFHIGPVIAEPEEGDAESAEEEYLTWLEAQPSRSVVFLCFGSRGRFSAAQSREIAVGLERSGKRFLWVVKSLSPEADFDESTMFPPGFEERTRGRGVVVRSWAQQKAVLRRDAVGAFVTHCGWNSVLEAVSAGVPMLAWPLYAEQHMNRNVIVQDLGIAVAVEGVGDGGGLVGGDEVERGLRVLMESERGREVRDQVLRMKDSAEAALGHLGDSAMALDSFVASIMTA